jgi:hypothetical protein
MPPPKRKRPAARATEPRANFENAYDSGPKYSRHRAARQSWQISDAEARETLRRAVAFTVLSLCAPPRSLNELLDGRPLIIVKVRTGVRGALACERIGEFVELGATVVLVALDLDAACMLDKIARRAQLRFATVAGSA